MALFNLPLDQLRDYRPRLAEPEDFDDFWERTLGEADSHDLQPRFDPYDARLTEVEVYDISFAG